MQTVAEEKRKAYRCVCWSANPITKDILKVRFYMCVNLYICTGTCLCVHTGVCTMMCLCVRLCVRVSIFIIDNFLVQFAVVRAYIGVSDCVTSLLGHSPLFYSSITFLSY